jgi:hypothetical protein
MTNRREFIQAMTLSGVPIVAGASLTVDAAASSPPMRTPEVQAVLFDARHAEARNLGARLASAGATVHALTDGDITQVWLNHIGPAWRQQPAAIAGLTTRSALFCLEQLALPYGLRVVFHAEHVSMPGGQISHSVLRGEQLARVSESDLGRAGPLWPERIAQAIATHREGAHAMRVGLSEAALEPPLPPGATLLTSWIIARA